MKIESIEKTLYEIAQVLAADEKIQRLLTIDTPDALSATYAVQPYNTILENEYVSISPHVENGIIKIDRTNELVIQFETIRFGEDRTGVSGSIMLITGLNRVALNNNHNRLLQIVGRIYELLQGRKFSAAGEFNIAAAENVTYDEFTYGYQIRFSFLNQETRKAEI